MIVSEKKHERKEVPPPRDISYINIPSMTSARDHKKFVSAFFNEIRPERDSEYSERAQDRNVRVYVSDNALAKMINHCRAYKEEKLEVMGFMIGDIYSYQGKDYAMVRDTVTSELDATNISVKFDSQSFESLFAEMDKIEYEFILTGWYHSHPGHTCFFSPTDVATQKRMFNKEFHSGIVIDPINIDMKCFTLNSDKTDTIESPFAVYMDNVYNPGTPQDYTSVDWTPDGLGERPAATTPPPAAVRDTPPPPKKKPGAKKARKIPIKAKKIPI